MEWKERLVSVVIRQRIKLNERIWHTHLSAWEYLNISLCDVLHHHYFWREKPFEFYGKRVTSTVVKVVYYIKWISSLKISTVCVYNENFSRNYTFRKSHTARRCGRNYHCCSCKHVGLSVSQFGFLFFDSKNMTAILKRWTGRPNVA